MQTDEKLSEKIALFLPKLDEYLGRLYLASEAQSLGRGGKQKIASIAKVSRTRIDKGLLELNEKDPKNVKKFNIRKAGGGRKKAELYQEGLKAQIEAIVNPHTRGDPMNPLLWTNKSLRNIEEALNEKGFKLSYVKIREYLKSIGYSLQANRKTDEGGKVEDRNEQFEHINTTAISFMSANCPVISVDCKKKGIDWELQKQWTGVGIKEQSHGSKSI